MDRLITKEKVFVQTNQLAEILINSNGYEDFHNNEYSAYLRPLAWSGVTSFDVDVSSAKPSYFPKRGATYFSVTIDPSIVIVVELKKVRK